MGLAVDSPDHYPHEFSGGMKQRDVIAMALVGYPALLIADEPVTALDVIVQHQVLKVLLELARELNLTVMLVTHDISVVAQVCNSVAIMYAGKIVEQAQALGASTVFSYRTEDWAAGIMEDTSGRGVDLVQDNVGAATWPYALRALARDGRLVTCGSHSGAEMSFDIGGIYHRHFASAAPTAARTRVWPPPFNCWKPATISARS